ncbi:MAG: sulfotransferase domain-containing protein [Gammaproteobacteria bacterium]|nr:sulfotransferase domain-containing protein [Gammaproteobacteria bacterium]
MSSNLLQFPTLFHVTHWKAGSQWINKILQQCFPDNIVQPKIDEEQFLREPILKSSVYPTLYVTKEQFDRVDKIDLPNYFVVFRDLRDTLISGYFSIKISHKLIDNRLVEWRNKLLSLDLDGGLLFLMDEWLYKSFIIQLSWATSGEKWIRYEDLLQHDYEIFESLFIDKFKLPISKERLRYVILSNRFENVTQGRERGVEDVNSHERKGIVGDWKNYFSERIKREFKERYGLILTVTGYEKNLDW